MDQDRDQIRQIEDARERVAHDVRSVTENANVVERTKENVRGRVDDAKSTVTRRVRDAREKLEAARDSIQSSMQGYAQNMRGNIGNLNPLGTLLAGLAVGFLIGLALPITRFESERLGPVADDVRGRIRRVRGEVTRRGSEVIKETIDAGRQAATSSIREQVTDISFGGEIDSPD